jgi:hypothetical protein
MERAKTPWENMNHDHSSFLRNVNKSSRRLEREERAKEIALKDKGCLCGGCFCVAKRIGVGIIILLLILMVLSFFSDLI